MSDDCDRQEGIPCAGSVPKYTPTITASRLGQPQPEDTSAVQAFQASSRELYALAVS